MLILNLHIRTLGMTAKSVAALPLSRGEPMHGAGPVISLAPDWRMMDESPPWLTGQLLLALPGVGDPRFDRAVIAMVRHDEGGAMGIMVGRTHPALTLGDVLAQLGIRGEGVAARPVLEGGPVEPQRGFVIHSRDWAGADAVDVAGQWMISSSPDVLRALAEGRGPTHWHFALGYAGWDAGQLEREFARHAWHVAPATNVLLFGDRPDRWADAFASVGVDTRLLSAAGGAA
jgi:putative transcriptional regulator